ncbi:MAG: hypothetical protein D6775_00335, partial [Caldilineae bacterium]
MTGRERARLAFAHREPDRVPLFELSIDNPTASYVLGREAWCGFGGYVRGVLQNRAMREGWYEAYHRRRIADEIALWRALDLDVYPNAAPVPRHPSVPEQVEENRWRFDDPATGLWTECVYAPESDMYDQVDSSLRREGLPALARLTEALEASEPSVD